MDISKQPEPNTNTEPIDTSAVSITVGDEQLRFEKAEIALVRLRCDF